MPIVKYQMPLQRNSISVEMKKWNFCIRRTNCRIKLLLTGFQVRQRQEPLNTWLAKAREWSPWNAQTQRHCPKGCACKWARIEAEKNINRKQPISMRMFDENWNLIELLEYNQTAATFSSRPYICKAANIVCPQHNNRDDCKHHQYKLNKICPNHCSARRWPEKKSHTQNKIGK